MLYITRNNLYSTITESIKNQDNSDKTYIRFSQFRAYYLLGQIVKRNENGGS